VIAAPDRAVQERVRDVLKAEGSGLIAARVAVDHGVVMVSGLADPRSRRLADSLVRSVPGVLDIQFGEPT